MTTLFIISQQMIIFVVLIISLVKKLIMITIHPQYIKNAKGKKSHVILTTKEFDAMVENIEDLEDLKLYHEAIEEDDGERIPLEEAIRMIEAKRNSIEQ